MTPDLGGGSVNPYLTHTAAQLMSSPRDPETDSRPVIEVDTSSFSDDDECYSSGLASDSTSLSESILDYEYENGRRYHAFRSGKYALPNDEQEQDRLDMMHHIYSLMLGGKLHLSPLDDPQHILDVGCGTGIWVIDMAE
jgi:hypothetical protein